MPIKVLSAVSITPSQVKAWQKVLQPLTKELQRQNGTSWTWVSGGCFAFAEQFAKVFGGKRRGIAKMDKSSGDYPVDHAVVELSGVLYDFNGRYTKPLKKGETVVDKDAEGTYWFEDEFLDDKQMKALKSALLKSKQLP